MDSTGPRPFSVQSSYTSTPEGEALSAEVSITRSPRGPEMLLDLAAGHAAGPIESILDVGCGKGRWSIALAQRFSARVLAVDLTRSASPPPRMLSARQAWKAASPSAAVPYTTRR